LRTGLGARCAAARRGIIGAVGADRLAHIASARAEAKIAGRIWGAIEAEANRAPFPGWERTRRLHADAILASDEFEIARQDGAELTLQTSVDELLEQRLE
jgi:hypothetical protein